MKTVDIFVFSLSDYIEHFNQSSPTTVSEREREGVLAAQDTKLLLMPSSEQDLDYNLWEKKSIIFTI